MSDWTVEPLNEADIAPSGSHDDCDGADDDAGSPLEQPADGDTGEARVGDDRGRQGHCQGVGADLPAPELPGKMGVTHLVKAALIDASC
jgi:hypothetical protein